MTTAAKRDQFDADPIGAHELALYIINTGTGYEDRCQAARQAWRAWRARAFAQFAYVGARLYERDFGNPGDTIFNAATTLLAAAELCAYYEQHVAETDALAKAEA